MNKSFLVSVILPLYNGRDFVAASVQSVLEQSYKNLELLVVDDGSSDGGAEEIPEDSRIHLFARRNAGVAAARNFGISRAKGGFIAFIDQDDCWYPEKLKLQVDVLEKKSKTGYVLTRMHNRLVGTTVRPAWLKPELLSEDPVGFLPSTLLVRRQIMLEVGGFNEQYINASDMDWFLRADELGVPREILDQVLIIRNIHGANCSYDNRTCKKEMFAILRQKIKSASRGKICE